MPVNPTALYTAAAMAAGVAPTDPAGYQTWLGRVGMIAGDLVGAATVYETREAHKRGEDLPEGSTVKTFQATLVNVERVTKGEGDNQVVKGKLVLKPFSASTNADDDGYERIETDLLSTPQGAAEYQRAMTLIGQDVIIYKRNFPHPTNKERKLKEVIAIEPVSGIMPIAAAAALPAGPPAAAAPAAQPSPPTQPAQQAQPANVPPPANDPVATAAAAQAEVAARTAPPQQQAPPVQAASPQQQAPAAGLADLDIGGHDDLVAAAVNHLGFTTEQIEERLTAKFGVVPAGRSLPARQYRNFWQELVGEQTAA